MLKQGFFRWNAASATSVGKEVRRLKRGGMQPATKKYLFVIIIFENWHAKEDRGVKEKTKTKLSENRSMPKTLYTLKNDQI